MLPAQGLRVFIYDSCAVFGTIYLQYGSTHLLVCLLDVAIGAKCHMLATATASQA
jgi:hypothetical protein